MSPTAVAFVPAAPLLVPQLAGGSAAVDEEMRVRCLDVVSRALDSDPQSVVAVATTAYPGTWNGEHSWDFAGFGVRRQETTRSSPLPWSLGIASWMLDEVGWSGPRRYVGVTVAEATPRIDLPDRSVLVVVGDGSGCRTERAPGHFDPRAEPFDDTVEDCLTRGDASALAAADESLADDLLCTGLPAWRWLAGVVDGSPVARAELLSHVAPYGVGYFVALWWF